MTYNFEQSVLWVPSKTSIAAANSVELERTYWTKSGLLEAKNVRVVISNNSIVFQTIYRNAFAFIAAYLGATITWDPAKKYFQKYADAHTTVSADAKQITLDPNSNKSEINKLRLHLAAACEGNQHLKKTLIDEMTLNVVKQILHPQPQTSTLPSKIESTLQDPLNRATDSPQTSPMLLQVNKKTGKLTCVEKTMSTVHKIFLWPVKNPAKTIIGGALLSTLLLWQGFFGNTTPAEIQKNNSNISIDPPLLTRLDLSAQSLQDKVNEISPSFSIDHVAEVNSALDALKKNGINAEETAAKTYRLPDYQSMFDKLMEGRQLAFDRVAEAIVTSCANSPDCSLQPLNKYLHNHNWTEVRMAVTSLLKFKEQLKNKISSEDFLFFFNQIGGVYPEEIAELALLKTLA